MNERLIALLLDSFPKILLPGLTMTIPLTVISFSIAMVIATAVALIQFAHVKVLSQIARFYIWVVRGTPLLVQLFVVFYGLPDVGILLDPFPAAVLVFAVNEGAYCAETMRAALESVPVGQIEAGYCVGMRYMQIMRRIVLPQALRNIVPTLLSQMITTIKDSSYMASLVTVELMACTKLIISKANAYNGTWVDRFNRGTIHVTDVFVLFGFAFLAYFAINFTLSCLVRRMRGRRSR